MLERILDVPEGVDGIRASGEITKEDYTRVLEPLLDEARREDRKVRLLYHFSPAFTGFSLGGAWEDTRLGLQHLRRFERCAIVSDVGWIRKASRFIGLMMPCPVGIFANEELGNAKQWLQRDPGESLVSHRLLDDTGILVLEPHGPLHREDVEEVALTVDTYLERHDDLNGVVVHAREFPGWEDFTSLLSHLQFVRDRHQHVGRVALAMDAPTAKLASKLGDFFVDAQLRQFDYDDYDTALRWASGRS